MLFCCLWSLEQFCSLSPNTSKATKISQINEGMSKIFPLQVQGVMGMWVGAYEQFMFWSLRSLNVTLLSLHFQKVFWFFITF
jgi:hypothetical protein